jgi:hypothetical protein
MLSLARRDAALGVVVMMMILLVGYVAVDNSSPAHEEYARVETKRTELVEFADGGGLEVQENDLGWGNRQSVPQQQQQQQQPEQQQPIEYEEGNGGDVMDTSRATAQRVYASVKKGLTRGMSALSGDKSLAQAYSSVAGLGSEVAPDVMAALSAYVPLAIGAQQELTTAMEHAPVRREHRRRTTMQYGLQINDEYDTLPQVRYCGNACTYIH